jgi:hypothetical protein
MAGFVAKSGNLGLVAQPNENAVIPEFRTNPINMITSSIDKI